MPTYPTSSAVHLWTCVSFLLLLLVDRHGRASGQVVIGPGGSGGISSIGSNIVALDVSASASLAAGTYSVTQVDWTSVFAGTPPNNFFIPFLATLVSGTSYEVIWVGGSQSVTASGVGSNAIVPGTETFTVTNPTPTQVFAGYFTPPNGVQMRTDNGGGMQFGNPPAGPLMVGDTVAVPFPIPTSILRFAITVMAVDPGAFGDPHLKTWHGQRFDFHGECDLILVQNHKFDHESGLDLHIRTTIRKEFSFVSAVALRIGENILEVHSFGEYYWNGVQGAELPNEMSGYPLSHKALKVKRSKDRRHIFQVDTGHGAVRFTVFKAYVGAYVANPTKEGFGDSVGLMGNFSSGQWLLRDGETVATDPIAFGNEWQVRDYEHQLFVDDGPIRFPKSCRLPPSVSHVKRRRLQEADDGVTMKMAEDACKDWTEDKDLCIQDVLASGDIDIAAAGAY